MDEFYNKHYITVDDQNRILSGWSDGPHPDRDATGAVLLTDKGGYQFRLWPDGEENPTLADMDGIPRYCWDGSEAVQRTEEEIEAERAAKNILAPIQLREQAYNTEAIISWSGEMITVTQAAQLWQYYAAEGNGKANELQTLIAEAKASIREKYPDEE